jgi:hypothetical protein
MEFITQYLGKKHQTAFLLGGHDRNSLFLFASVPLGRLT